MGNAEELIFRVNSTYLAKVNVASIGLYSRHKLALDDGYFPHVEAFIIRRIN